MASSVALERWIRAAIIAALATTGCATAPGATPPYRELTERELLALSMSAVAGLSGGERAAWSKQLDGIVTKESAEPATSPANPSAVPAAPEVALALPSPIRAVLALDLERRRSGLPPLLLASAAGSVITPLAARTLFPSPRPPGAPPGRSFDFSLSSLAPPHEAAAQLDALLASAPPTSDPIHVVPAPSAPFAVIYLPSERAVYVNTALFALRGTPADQAWAEDATRQLTRAKVCSPGDVPCLADALSIASVAQCVKRVAPACAPATPAGLASLVAADPGCLFRIEACVGSSVVDSPCGPMSGPCSTPCTTAGAQSGSMCGHACGSACAGACTACGVTGACDSICMDFCRTPCGTQCAADCERQCSDCGASAGASSSRSCAGALGEAGTCRTDFLVYSGASLPPPPLDPLEAPPMRALAITSARDLAAFFLPPLLFLGLLRRGSKRGAPTQGPPQGSGLGPSAWRPR